MDVNNLTIEAIRHARTCLYAPPTIEKIELKFRECAACTTYHLYGPEILKIIKIVLEEDQKSSEFGFHLRENDIVLESIVYCSAFHVQGGTSKFKENFSYEDAYVRIGEITRLTLNEEITYYVEEARKNGRNPNEITCHLEAVRSRILNELYNGGF